MEIEERFLKTFVERTIGHLHDNLAGIYLHGSLAMGCYLSGRSDVDLLVVIKVDLSKSEKRALIEEYMEIEKQYHPVKLELSVVLQEILENFDHPTPFLLHYSSLYKDRYESYPNYICGNGLDPDLAAHFTVIYERGRCLYGKEIKELFPHIPREAYLDSILYDINDAEEEITSNPVYYILNLCRVLYFVEKGMVSSKKEAGEWGVNRLPSFRGLIEKSLSEYAGNQLDEWNVKELEQFAKELQLQITSAT
ncbi:aminoglycoside adenylyltransferase domain-containing protein [Chungangia koreensis]|uniref:Spectinomycin 9-adenylyltransferase n=1 Tax=Chungangia koreensis TaxID=752657 RepID=A0ABV8X5T4_9LACT